MNNYLRKTLALVIAVMVVTTVAVTGPGPVPDDADPVGESQALACGGVCIGVAIGGAAAAGAIAGWLAADGGDVPKEKVDEMVASQDDQQKVDLSMMAVNENSTSRQYITSLNNTLEDSRAIASMKAKARMAEMINNGTTDVSTISTEVNKTIEDYYAVRQKNLITRWNSHAAQYKYIAESINNDSGISETELFMSPSTSNTAPDFNGFRPSKFQGEAITLVNGSTKNATQLWWEQTDGSNTYDYYATVKGMYFENGDYDSTNSRTPRVAGINVSNDSIKTVRQSGALDIPHKRFEDLFERIDTSASDMTVNYGPNYVESVVAQYKAGEINSSDLVTPEILANEWGTNYNQTGDSIYRWANMAALGLESPDLNETANMQINYTRRPLTRMVRFNVTAESWSDSTPVNMTLKYPDGSETSHELFESGDTAANAETVVTIPEKDGPYRQDIEVVLSWTEGGELLNFTPGGASHAVDGGNMTLKQEVVTEVHASEHGMLFSDAAPSNGWNVSSTYQISNLGDTVYWGLKDQTLPEFETLPAVYKNETEDNIPDMLNLGETTTQFTVVDAQNDAGDSISTVKTRDYNLQTTNASKLTEEVEQLSEVRKRIEALAPEVSAAGGGFLSGFFDHKGIPGMPGNLPEQAAGGGVIFVILSRAGWL